MSVMIERLEGMVNRYHEINEMMMSPEIVTDSKMLAKLGREQADLTQVVETYTEYKNSVSAVSYTHLWSRETIWRRTSWMSIYPRGIIR